MSNRETLMELAERVEKATGPDTAIDRDIAFALDLPDIDEFGCAQSWSGLCYDGTRWGDRAKLVAPKFSASLDAAMMLAEGLERFGGAAGILREALDRMWPIVAMSDLSVEEYRQTLARQFTAASLKALAAGEQS